jgi:hypothetical protein
MWNLLYNSKEREELEQAYNNKKYKFGAEDELMNKAGLETYINNIFKEIEEVKDLRKQVVLINDSIEKLRNALTGSTSDATTRVSGLIEHQQQQTHELNMKQTVAIGDIVTALSNMANRNENLLIANTLGNAAVSAGDAGIVPYRGNTQAYDNTSVQMRSPSEETSVAIVPRSTGARAPTQDELMAERMQEEEDRKAEMRQRRTRDTTNEKENRGSDDAEDDSKKKQGGNHTTHRKRKTHGGNRKTKHKRKTQHKRKVHGKRKTHGKRK